jgi:hypothetical protein
MLAPTLPLNFNVIRKAIVDEVQKVTGRTCIMLEAEAPNAPRPDKPYFGMKFLTPAGKFGDDSQSPVLDGSGNPTTVWNFGGQRKMIVEFDCYGQSHEDAYNYLTLWQQALELETTQADLRLVGLAVCLNGEVADRSALLNTGFEGRAQMDVQFGIASNMTADLGEMDTAVVQGTVSHDQGSQTITETITDGD